MGNFTVGSMSYSADERLKTAEERSFDEFERLKANAHEEIEALAQQRAKLQRAQTALNLAMESIDRAILIKEKVRADVDALWAQKQYTTEYLSAEVEKVRNRANEELRGLLEGVQSAVVTLREKVDSERGKLDLKDSGFQTALQLIQMGGDALDASTQREIIALLSGNAATLKAILPVAKKKDLHIAVQTAEAEIARLERAALFPEKLSETAPSLLYSIETAVNVSEIYAYAELFAKAYGLKVPERAKGVVPYLMRNAAGL